MPRILVFVMASPLRAPTPKKMEIHLMSIIYLYVKSTFYIGVKKYIQYYSPVIDF